MITRIQPILVSTKIFCFTFVFSSIALKSIPPTTMTKSLNSTLAMPTVVMIVKSPSSSAFLHFFRPVLFSPFVYSLHLRKTDISFDLLLIHSTCSLVGIDTNLFALGAPTSLCCTFLYGAFSFCFSLPPAPTMSTIYSLPRWFDDEYTFWFC